MLTENPDVKRMKLALERGLTVEELIAELQGLDPKAKVVFHHASGDYWGTQVATPVRSVDMTDVEWASNNNSLKIAKERCEWSDDDDFYPFDEDGNPIPEAELELEPEDTISVVAIGEVFAGNFS
jgi:hypothetical protein